MASTYEEYEILLHSSIDFLKEAMDAFEKGRYDVAVILAEQAVQLRIKAALLLVKGSYPRIHQLRVLLRELGESIGGMWSNRIKDYIKSRRALLSELEDVYIITRYSPKRYAREDALELLKTAREVIDLVDEACRSYREES